MIVIEVRIPPNEILSMNKRGHWSEEARRKKALRARGAMAWRQAIGRRRPHWDKARCVAYITLSARTPRRPHDGNNLSATTKPLIDGIISGPHGARNWPGLLPDDDSTHLEGPDHRITALPDPNLPRGWLRVRLEFEEITND